MCVCVYVRVCVRTVGRFLYYIVVSVTLGFVRYAFVGEKVSQNCNDATQSHIYKLHKSQKKKTPTLNVKG